MHRLDSRAVGGVCASREYKLPFLDQNFLSLFSLRPVVNFKNPHSFYRRFVDSSIAH